MERKFGSVENAENLVSVMMDNRRKWEIVSGCVGKIMRVKEGEERERQREDQRR